MKSDNKLYKYNAELHHTAPGTKVKGPLGRLVDTRESIFPQNDQNNFLLLPSLKLEKNTIK